MNISYINTVSFGKKNKTKKEDIKTQIQKGNEYSKELIQYMNSDKIQNILERMPAKDGFFISVSQVNHLADEKVKVTNPELIYCEDFYNKSQTGKSKKLEMHSYEVEINKKFSKKDIKKWLTSLFPQQEENNNI